MTFSHGFFASWHNIPLPLQKFQKQPDHVVHTCNPSHSGGRDEEDCVSKPTQANRSQDSVLKKHPSRKRAGGVVQSVGLKFEPQYRKTNKQKTPKREMLFLLMMKCRTA
jgi:hypothetical protein